MLAVTEGARERILQEKTTTGYSQTENGPDSVCVCGRVGVGGAGGWGGGGGVTETRPV